MNSQFKNITLVFSLICAVNFNAKSEQNCNLDKLFSSNSSNLNLTTAGLKLKIESDFSKALSLKQNVDPFADTVPSLFVPATLQMSGINRTFKAEIKARGNSVLIDPEVTFPKLKIEISDDENLTGTPFDKQRNFRINTHLADVKQSRNSELTGRLLGDLSPIRENLAYTIARFFGLAAPQTQLAQVTYVDTQTHGSSDHVALLIETDKKIAKRLKSEIVDTFGPQGAQIKVSSQDAALFMTYHALVGNADYSLKVHEKDLMETEKNRYYWNTFIIKTETGSYVPVVYDLDLATIVTQKQIEMGSQFKFTEFGLQDAKQAYFFSRYAKLRQKLSDADLLKAFNYVNSRLDQLKNIVSTSGLDAQTKSNALEHFEYFAKYYTQAMTSKVIAVADMHFYEKANLKSKKKTILSKSDNKALPLRPGTPIKILAEEGDFYKVAILDINGDLQQNQSSVGYIKKSAVGDHVSDDLLGWQDERDI